MSDPFIGEIKIFAGNFAPKGWAFCNGQTLPISQNTALFSLLGTIYGGDGKTTFALPKLEGRAPMHAGSGPGLTPRALGQAGGSPQVTVTASSLPVHTHQAGCYNGPGDVQSPAGAVWAGGGRGAAAAYAPTANTTLKSNALGMAGGGQAHNNMQPYLGINFIIALVGIYPQRS